MANIKSAAKRARQTVKRTESNRRVTSNIRTQLKRVRGSVAEGKKDEATANYKATISALDKAAKNGRIHRNAASRQKSKLSRALNSLS